MKAWASALLVTVVLSACLEAQATPPASAAVTAGTQLPPEVKIPVDPLGFLPPGDLPAFYYYALVELHFIDADHLLFAFNAPGLLRRDDDCPDSGVQRRVHAVVFGLPSGQVQRQVDWKLYDFMDFMWGLGDGRLLMRRCNQLDTIDANLDPQLLIAAVGQIEDVSFSPDRSMLVVQEKQTAGSADEASGAIPSMLAKETETQRTNVNFIQLHPLHIIGRAEIPLPSAIPVIANGLFEVLTAPNDQWVVNLQVFHGSERQIASIHSLCPPMVRAISNSSFLAMICSKGDQKALAGYNLEGSPLWQIPLTSDQYDWRLIPIANGTRFAIESLRLKRPRAALDPLTKEDVAGEDIDIYDSLSGVRVATFRTMPAYTGGRNVDFSPDGQRMAVLHEGVIEIYQLSNLMKAFTATPH